MAEIINLRRARKAKRRVAAAQDADANRVVYGRTTAEREMAEKEKLRLKVALDQAKRER